MPNRQFLWLTIRITILVALISAAFWLSDWLRLLLESDLMPHNEAMIHKVIVLSLIGLVVLMALPFLPGAEIGLALLTAFGAPIAPAVYVAAILGLSVAFLIGRLVPVETTAAALRSIRLRRAAELMDEVAALPQDQVLQHLVTKTQFAPARHLINLRYLLLVLLINMPGNIILGGGGGIAMLAGLSRCFHPLAFLLAIVIAVLPLPMAALIFAG